MAPSLTLAIAWRSLRRHPLRTALAAAGVVVGVAAVVAMLAVGRGAQREVDGYLRAIGSNVLLLLPASVTAGGVRQGSGSSQWLTESDARAIALELDEVVAAAPTIRQWTQVVARERNWSTIVYGTTDAYFDVREWGVAAGRIFTDDELSGAGRVIVLGSTVARELFGADAPADMILGAAVRVRGVPFTVIGVLESKGQHLAGEDADDAAFVPLATARTRLFGAVQGRIGRIHAVILKVREGVPAAQGREAVLRLIRQRHGLAPGRDDTVTVRDLTERVVARQEAGRAMTLLLAAIASVSLLVGGVGILNVMLVSVAERTREIGVRLAVGARRRDILQQFVVEAATLALAGGTVGLGLGVAAAEALSWRAGWPAAHDAAALAAAFGVAAVVGIAAGLYPAWRAARLHPVDALRHE